MTYSEEKELSQFNPGQKEAVISPLKQNILISAGAGSGKTKTLSYKVFHLVEFEGIKPSEILVMTFTDKAALEMKERILKQFSDHKSNYRDEMMSAHIQTFDSFSSYLVKKYASLLQIPDTVQILDDSILLSKKREILDGVLQKHFVTEKERMVKTFSKLCPTYNDYIRELIFSIDNELNKLLPSKKKEFIEHYDELFLTRNGFEHSLDIVVNQLKSNLKATLISCLFAARTNGCYVKQIVENIDDEANYELTEHSDMIFQSQTVKRIYQYIYHLLNVPSFEFFFEANKLMTDPEISKDFSSGVYRTIKKELKDDNAYQIEYEIFVKQIKYILMAKDNPSSIKNKISLYGTDMERQYQQNLSLKDDIHLIFELLSEMNEELDQFKRQINCYTFSDIEYKALSLLTDPKYASASEEIKKRFRYILVDEYQDTNDIQETFLNFLSENATLFCVGDAKQSIYRFRNSNVQLFMDRKENYEKNPELGKVISMNWNYRSSFKLLDSINLIFDFYMTKEHGGIDYSERNRFGICPQRLDHDPSFIRSESQNSFYGLGLLQFSNLNPSKDAELEMETIFNDINDKVSNHYQIADGKSFRDCRYSDFVILLRNKNHFSDYEKYFNDNGIPLNIITEEHLTQINAILLLQSLIKLISAYIQFEKTNKPIEENQKELFASIARSYIYGKRKGYDDDKIYHILTSKDFFKDEIMLKIKKFAHDHKDSAFSVIFLDLLNDFDIIKDLSYVGDVVSNVDKIESFYQIVCAQEAIGQGIEDFVSLFKNISKYKIEIKAETNIEIENAVTIMTIHKSKGLEFPIVYMPLHFNTMRRESPVKLKPNISLQNGLILPFYTLDDISSNIKNEAYYVSEGSDFESINEHIRIFYVALTRAKDCLYIVGNEDVNAMSTSTTGTLYDMLKSTFHYLKINDCYFDYGRKNGIISEEQTNCLNALKEELKILYNLPVSHSPSFEFRKARQEILDQEKKKREDKMKDILSSIEMDFMNRFLLESSSFNMNQKAKYLALARFHNEAILDYASFVEQYPDYKNVESMFDSDIHDIQIKIKQAKKEDKKEKKPYTAYQFQTLAWLCLGFDRKFIVTQFDDKVIQTKHVSRKTNNAKKEENFLLPSLKIDDSDIVFFPKCNEKKRASKQILDDEELDAKINLLDYGTKLHTYLELTDFHTKDTSFITDKKDREIINKVLSLPLFSDLSDAKVFHEYSYFDEQFQTTGSIDCLIIKPKEILIIDYKTKNISDPEYDSQLKVYRRNIEFLFPDKEVRMILLSILNCEIREVK